MVESKNKGMPCVRPCIHSRVISRELGCQTQVRHPNRSPSLFNKQLVSTRQSDVVSCQLLLFDDNFYILCASVKWRLKRAVSHPHTIELTASGDASAPQRPILVPKENHACI